MSRYRPEFTKGPLEHRLAAEDLRYVFMGNVLGGRPDDPACYDEDGHVDYARCRERSGETSRAKRFDHPHDLDQPAEDNGEVVS